MTSGGVDELAHALATRQSTTAYPANPTQSNYAVRRATHYWIHNHRSHGWSILSISLTQHAVLTEEITPSHTSSKELGKLTYSSKLHSILPPTQQSRLVITEYDQWTPRWLIELSYSLTNHPTNRLLLLEHKTPLRL